MRRMHVGMLRPLRISSILLRDPQPDLKETPNERLRLYVCEACSKTVRGRGQAIAHISVCPEENRSDFGLFEVASKRVEDTSSGLELPSFPK